MRTILFFYLIIICFSSCSEPEKDLGLSCNFENILPWNNSHNTKNIKSITNLKAHSGTYSFKLDSTQLYGFMFISKFEEILKQRAKKAIFKAWINSEDPLAKAKLVVAINNKEGKQLYWQAMDAKIKLNNWEETTSEFDLKTFVSKGNTIVCYVLNDSKAIIFCDDLKIDFQ